MSIYKLWQAFCVYRDDISGCDGLVEMGDRIICKRF